MKEEEEFACTEGCVRCCTDESSPPELTLEDIKRITDAMKIGPEEFLENCEITWTKAPYISLFYPFISLKMPCNFLVNGRCSIYEVRPLHCQLYPELIFLESFPDKREMRKLGFKCRGTRLTPEDKLRVQDLSFVEEKESEDTANILEIPRYGFRIPEDTLDEIFSVLEKKHPTKQKRRAVLRRLCTERIDPALREAVHREFFIKTASKLAQ